MRSLFLAALFFALPAFAASPTYISNGGMTGTAGGNVDVTYPSSPSSDDIFILFAGCSRTDVTYGAVSGWNGPIQKNTEPGDATAAWYWKRSAGTESGTVTVTRSPTQGTSYGVIAMFRGCVTTEAPHEQEATNQADSNTASSSSVTPTTDDTRIVCLIAVEDDVSIATLSGGDYAEDFELNDATGQDFAFAVDSFAMSTATTEGAQTASLGGTDSWITFTLALKSLAAPDTGRRRSNVSG